MTWKNVIEFCHYWFQLQSEFDFVFHSIYTAALFIEKQKILFKNRTNWLVPIATDGIKSIKRFVLKSCIVKLNIKRVPRRIVISFSHHLVSANRLKPLPR